MRRIIQVQYELPCNKWTCGRCERGACEYCTLFPPDRGFRAIHANGHDYYRVPACIAADTDLTPCEAGCRREATHTDGDGNGLCTPCWNTLIREDKAARAEKEQEHGTE